jgi:hypothetical protein
MPVEFDGVSLWNGRRIRFYTMTRIFPIYSKDIGLQNSLSSRARARQKDAVTRHAFQPRYAEGADLCRNWKQSLPNDLYVAYSLETGVPIRGVYVRNVHHDLEFSFIFQWYKVENLAEQSSEKRETENMRVRLKPFAEMACRGEGELI